MLDSVAAAAAKSLQSCPTLCDPIDSSPPASPVPGILQARTLEWVAISFSSAWKWKVKVKSLSSVWPSATPWTAAHQAPPSMGFSRQEYWSGPLSRWFWNWVLWNFKSQMMTCLCLRLECNKVWVWDLGAPRGAFEVTSAPPAGCISWHVYVSWRSVCVCVCVSFPLSHGNGCDIFTQTMAVLITCLLRVLWSHSAFLPGGEEKAN